MRVEQRPRHRRAELQALDAHRAVDAVAALVGVVGAGVHHAHLVQAPAQGGRDRDRIAGVGQIRMADLLEEGSRHLQALGIGEVEVRLLDVGA